MYPYPHPLSITEVLTYITRSGESPSRETTRISLPSSTCPLPPPTSPLCGSAVHPSPAPRGWHLPSYYTLPYPDPLDLARPPFLSPVTLDLITRTHAADLPASFPGWGPQTVLYWHRQRNPGKQNMGYSARGRGREKESDHTGPAKTWEGEICILVANTQGEGRSRKE